ncbi:MAG TPA: DedA family protein [Vicinamibacterales bacterium]|nr:DedA family protein [Vicinamibacterales bacterium]
MNLGFDHSGGYAYLLIFLAAAVEGEIVFVTASVLVALGRLDPLAVWLVGAAGGSVGDQFFFFALRGRLRHWMSRFRGFAKRREAITARVQSHGNWLMLGCRFLPGLRIAIPAACAYAGIPALRFVTLNFTGALVWAGSIMLAVTWLGPTAAKAIGLHGLWGLLVPAVLIVLFFRWLARDERKQERQTRKDRS